MKRKILLILGLCLIGLIISGCQLFFFNTESLIATQVAEAIDEKIAEIEAANNAAASGQASSVLPSPTPYPTYTPYPTLKPPTYYSNSYSYLIGTPGGCLNAIFISENYPDNTVFSPGDSFIKSWTIKNTGYCEWNTNYRLVFLEGSSMGGDTYKYLSETVSPGESITLTANLTAPSSTGTYRGEWRVQSDLGLNFARFWVQIVVR